MEVAWGQIWRSTGKPGLLDGAVSYPGMLVAPGLAVRGKSPADHVHAALTRTLITDTSGTSPPTRVIGMSSLRTSSRAAYIDGLG